MVLPWITGKLVNCTHKLWLVKHTGAIWRKHEHEQSSESLVQTRHQKISHSRLLRTDGSLTGQSCFLQIRTLPQKAWCWARKAKKLKTPEIHIVSDLDITSIWMWYQISQRRGVRKWGEGWREREWRRGEVWRGALKIIMFWIRNLGYTSKKKSYLTHSLFF